MSPATSIVWCAVLFFAVSLCDSFSKDGESELKRDRKIAGIEDTGAEWGDEGNFKGVNELDEMKTNQYGMEQDGTLPHDTLTYSVPKAAIAFKNCQQIPKVETLQK